MSINMILVAMMAFAIAVMPSAASPAAISHIVSMDEVSSSGTETSYIMTGPGMMMSVMVTSQIDGKMLTFNGSVGSASIMCPDFGQMMVISEFGTGSMTIDRRMDCDMMRDAAQLMMSLLRPCVPRCDPIPCCTMGSTQMDALMCYIRCMGEMTR